MITKFFAKKQSRLESLVMDFINKSICGLRKSKWPCIIRNVCDLNLKKALAKSGYTLSKKEIKEARKIAQSYISSLGYKPSYVRYQTYPGSWILEFVVK